MKIRILAFLIILLLLPLFVYLVKFGTIGISSIFKDWSSFSQFYTLYSSFLSTILLGFLGWFIHKESISYNKPILIFTIEPGRYPHKVKNIGNGPAINIEIFYGINDKVWACKIKGLTLAKDGEFILPIEGQRRLGAIYYDQSGNHEISYMIDTKMRFKNIASEFSQKVEKEIFIWQL